MKKNKAVVWFSCGASSAVAGKLAVDTYGDEVDLVYCDTGGEHESNKQFLLDCQEWYGKEIIILKNEKYEDHFDVVRKTRFVNGPHGARCTTELKQKMREKAQYCESINIYGYTIEETERAKKFEDRNMDLLFDWILIKHKITKPDCLGIIWQQGIKLPIMYELGYDHNNCIGCVKGGKGYWNRIRKDFPDHFNRMAKIEREIGATCLKEVNGDKIYLDTLDPNRGNFKSEEPISCGIDCLETLALFEERKER